MCTAGKILYCTLVQDILTMNQQKVIQKLGKQPGDVTKNKADGFKAELDC
jgi:hypothetical protein